ncbi:YjcZ family sporulation protein [Sporosarcina sp. E16_3]|nr:YjcZ family sporulation protein [Sporosarcina sp. E16_3]MBO0601465.1 YjcZ family sporulation protein [Sporosarcina sp. E16_3]
MYGGCNPYGGGYGGGCEPERASYGGSTFVLIVVLFILLIIVGRSFCV